VYQKCITCQAADNPSPRHCEESWNAMERRRSNPEDTAQIILLVTMPVHFCTLLFSSTSPVLKYITNVLSDFQPFNTEHSRNLCLRSPK